jgi:tetratricopeptide (TPR) repeat protein
LRLQVLGAATVFELVRQLSGAADPQRFAARLEQASGGNPFFIAETLRHWQALQMLSVGADGVWQTPFDQSTPDYDELPMPDSVRAAVLARVRRLPDPARRLLEAAALAAEPFTPALLAGACALSEVEALEAIDAAVQAQLLRERDDHAGNAGGYAFAHDLVQQALDSSLSAERRRLVHRRLALGAEAAALPSTERARHWEAGGEPQRAVAHRIEAGDAAAALYADRDADQHWLAALSDQPTLAQRVQIQRRRWGHQRDRDDKPGLEQSLAELDRLHAEAMSLPPSPANTELAQIAAIEAAEILSLTGGSAAALERIEACLPGLAPDSAQRVQALQVLTQALNGVGRTNEALQAARQALALPKLSPARQAQLLHAQVYSYFLQGQPAPALECTQRCLLLWRSLGQRRSVARALANVGLLLGMLDQQQEAITALQEAQSAAAELGMVDQQREVANNLAYAHLALGQAQQALDVLQQAWDLSPHFTQQFRPIFFQSMRVQAHAQRASWARRWTAPKTVWHARPRWATPTRWPTASRWRWTSTPSSVTATAPTAGSPACKGFHWRAWTRSASSWLSTWPCNRCARAIRRQHMNTWPSWAMCRPWRSRRMWPVRACATPSWRWPKADRRRRWTGWRRCATGPCRSSSGASAALHFSLRIRTSAASTPPTWRVPMPRWRTRICRPWRRWCCARNACARPG